MRVERRGEVVRLFRAAAVLCLPLLAAGSAAAVPGEDAGRLFDPKRPPERDLELGGADGCTLASVGDCIISRPLAPMLATDAEFAAVVKILRDADATFGNFETSAFDIGHFQGSPHSWGGDWTLLATPEVGKDLKAL